MHIDIYFLKIEEKKRNPVLETNDSIQSKTTSSKRWSLSVSVVIHIAASGLTILTPSPQLSPPPSQIIHKTTLEC